MSILCMDEEFAGFRRVFGLYGRGILRDDHRFWRLRLGKRIPGRGLKEVYRIKGSWGLGVRVCGWGGHTRLEFIPHVWGLGVGGFCIRLLEDRFHRLGGSQYISLLGQTRHRDSRSPPWGETMRWEVV